MTADGPGAFLLETSALLALYLGEPEGAEVAAILATGCTAIASTPSAAEFCQALMSAGEAAADALAAWARMRAVLDAVASVAEQTSLLAAQIAAEAPARLPMIDALIAACAKERGACLVHRDRHMRALDPAVVRHRFLGTE